MYGTYQKSQHLFEIPDTGGPFIAALEVSVGVKAYFYVLTPIEVKEFIIDPYVAFNYDTQTVEAIVKLRKYPKYGDTGNVVDIAHIHLTHGTAISAPLKTSKMDSEAYAKCDPGSVIVLQVTTAGTGGASIAGDWKAGFTYHDRGEVKGNLANVVTDQGV